MKITKLILVIIALISSVAGFSQNTHTVIKQRLESVVIMGNIFNPDALSKTTFFYDEHENNTLRIEYLWKPTINDWWESRKYEYTYDDKKNIIIEIVEDFRDSLIKNWFVYPLSKNEYTYDTNRNLTMNAEYRWNSIDNEWEEIRKEKIEYVYDNNRNITKEICYHWGSMKNIWGKSYKYEYTYDTHGNRKKTVLSYYSSKKNVWKKDHKLRFTHDVSGNLIKVIDNKRLGRRKSVLEKRYKIEYMYDSNQNLIRTISYDRTKKYTWREKRKYDYIYDTSYSSENLIIPQCLYYSLGSKCGYYYNYMLLEESIYKWKSNNWESISVEKYYYSPQTK